LALPAIAGGSGAQQSRKSGRPSKSKAAITRPFPALVAYDAAYASGLSAERAKVEAERAKAEKVIAEFAARDAQRADELKAEQAQTEKAIAAFSALADRLDALAAERSRPWWRRWVS
jgi:hypothetical protein